MNRKMKVKIIMFGSFFCGYSDCYIRVTSNVVILFGGKQRIYLKTLCPIYINKQHTKGRW